MRGRALLLSAVVGLLLVATATPASADEDDVTPLPRTEDCVIEQDGTSYDSNGDPCWPLEPTGKEKEFRDAKEAASKAYGAYLDGEGSAEEVARTNDRLNEYLEPELQRTTEELLESKQEQQTPPPRTGDCMVEQDGTMYDSNGDPCRPLERTPEPRSDLQKAKNDPSVPREDVQDLLPEEQQSPGHTLGAPAAHADPSASLVNWFDASLMPADTDTRQMLIRLDRLMSRLLPLDPA